MKKSVGFIPALKGGAFSLYFRNSVYAARQWPDGEIKIIGQDGCSCGSTDFELVDDSADGTESDAG
ncbi:hypothetical protein C478_14222 [Natrinema thermotolerans DSM 11552]|nr:hypothetical protein C478_14222 [Natrinema thermotolerans DSM 11552]